MDVHPVFAAKALVTADHVSNGRAGLNIVAGWNQGEFDMFGHTLAERDRRYEQGAEWYDVMMRIFSAREPFDHDGEFCKMKGVIAKPPPVQMPCEAAAGLIVDTRGCFTPCQQRSCNSSTCPAS